MDRKITLRDRISARDTLTLDGSFKPSVIQRTQVIGGYDYYVDEHGCSQLGEVLFEKENQIVLGGAMFILEKLYGVRSPLAMESLNSIMGIATTGPEPAPVYPDGRTICLFGVGTGGAGDSITSIKEAKFYDRELSSMIPFRVSADELKPQEKGKYWFRKDMGDGKVAHYLKRFAVDPVMRILWKDGEEDEDGSPVTSSPHEGSRETPIETFEELVLQIEKKDIREWFQLNGNIEQARVNTIGLFTGVLGDLGDGTQDYKDVRLFSKLNIDNEMLRNMKTLTFIYRTFTS